MTDRERDVFMKGTYEDEMPDTSNRHPLIVPRPTAPPPWKSEKFGRYDGPTEEQQKKIDQKNEEKKNTELKKRLESVINSFSSKIPGKNHHKLYSMSKQDKMLSDISSRTSVAARKEAEMIKAARGHTQTKHKYTSIPPKGGKYRRRKTNRHKSKRRKSKRRKTNRRRSYRR